GERGLPVVIYRPGRAAGHSRSGAWNTADLICQLLKGCSELGLAPELDTPMDLTPVDYLSQAIVHLSRSKEAAGQTYHLRNPVAAEPRVVFERMREAGLPVREVPLAEWLAALDEAVQRAPDNSLAALMPLLNKEVGADASGFAESEHDCSRALAGLEGSFIS